MVLIDKPSKIGSMKSTRLVEPVTEDSRVILEVSRSCKTGNIVL